MVYCYDKALLPSKIIQSFWSEGIFAQVALKLFLRWLFLNYLVIHLLDFGRKSIIVGYPVYH
jgi:hypothetical protein